MTIQPDQPQSIGGVLDNTFQLYKASVFKVWALCLLAAIAGALPSIYVLLSGPVEAVGTVPSTALLTSPAYWCINLLAIILSLWVAAALYLRQHGIGVGEDPGSGVALARSLGRLFPLILMSLLFGLVVTIGVVLLIIPGVILTVSLILGANLLIIEGKGPIEALKSSHSLIWGNWWRTAVILTVGLIIVIVAYVVAGIVIGILVGVFGMGGDVANAFVVGTMSGLLVGVLMTFLVTPFYTALVLAIYWDLKLRREGGDLASRVAALGAA